MKTLFSVTVDTEEEWNWGAEWPTGDLAVTNIRNLPRFQRLCSRHQVAPTYFVNQAVLDDDEARTTLLGLTHDGPLEIGMHIHPWNTPPVVNGHAVQIRETYLHNLPDELIDAKLESVYRQFEKHGLKPTSFRGGRYSSGGRIHEFLHRRGFVADSSVVPFTSWEDDGAPDYRDRDIYPQRRKNGSNGGPALWEIPLTRGFTRKPFGFWAGWHRAVETTWLSRLHLIGIVNRLGIVRRSWLNFEDTPAAEMLQLLDRLRPMQLPCICLTMHSSSLMAGTSVYTRSPADEERIFAAVDEVLGTLARWPEFQSATMSDVARHLEEQHDACARN